MSISEAKRIARWVATNRLRLKNVRVRRCSRDSASAVACQVTGRKGGVSRSRWVWAYYDETGGPFYSLPT
jgi:hypothetical protein